MTSLGALLLFLLLLVIGVPVAVALGLAARPGLSLFGPGYPAADTVLVYLLVGNVTWAAAALSILWLQYTRRGTVIIAITAATLVVDSALNVLLIPRFGMNGAAAGTAVTMTLASAVRTAFSVAALPLSTLPLTIYVLWLAAAKLTS